MKEREKLKRTCHVYNQNFLCGGSGWGRRYSEKCLKLGGAGVGVIKESLK